MVRHAVREIRIKRVYEPSDPGDGKRILVDRIWPRGVSKEAAALHFWAKDCAPSTELRKWYDHQVERWPEFKTRYARELSTTPAAVDALRKAMGSGTVTFLFSSRETERNTAVALAEWLGARAVRVDS